MRRLIPGFFLLASSFLGLSSARAQSAIAIGSTPGPLTVTGTSGPVTIAPDKAPATVVMFVSAHCPVSSAYNGRMNALHQEYAAKNVQFFFLDANVNETQDDIASLGMPAKIGTTVYRDTNNQIADKLGASATPEVYVFDPKGVLSYHGAIDDSQKESEVKTQSLRKALDAMLAGKSVDVATTKAFGCSIKRKQTT